MRRESHHGDLPDVSFRRQKTVTTSFIRNDLEQEIMRPALRSWQSCLVILVSVGLLWTDRA
ncbi:MAG: hypothetical protein ACREOR_10330, partial [Candidatus Binatia bacterium]